MGDKIENPSEEQKYRAPALSKGLDILELLASEADGFTQVEIAKKLGRTTSEIFRMLMVLRQRGYVDFLSDDDRYHLTTKLFEVAHRHPPIRRLTAIAGDSMQRLANQINQSLHLGIIHSGELLVIAQVDCPDNNNTSVRLGAHIPIYDTASGRVLAAWLEPPALDALLNGIGRDPANKFDAFVADLPKVRETGYFVSPSLTISGVINISAPVFDFSGKVVAAITIPFVQRLTDNKSPDAQTCRDMLVEVAADMSRRLGSGAR